MACATARRLVLPPKLTTAQMSELHAVLLAGSDPAVHGVVRWRYIDLRAEVARRFCVDVDDDTIGIWLRKFGLIRLQPRPFHPNTKSPGW